MSKRPKLYKVEPIECPVCGERLNASSPVNDEDIAPKEYDITICDYCSTVMVFNKHLKPKVITTEEFGTIKNDYPEVSQEINNVVQEILSRRGISPDISNP